MLCEVEPLACTNMRYRYTDTHSCTKTPNDLLYDVDKEKYNISAKLNFKASIRRRKKYF